MVQERNEAMQSVLKAIGAWQSYGQVKRAYNFGGRTETKGTQEGSSGNWHRLRLTESSWGTSLTQPSTRIMCSTRIMYGGRVTKEGLQSSLS